MNTDLGQEVAPGSLAHFVPGFGAVEGWEEVLAALRQGGSAALDRVWGSSCALAAAALVEALGENAGPPLLVVLPTSVDVDHFVDDFSTFSPRACVVFPAWEREPGDRVVHDEIHGERLHVLKVLARGEFPRVLATSIQALLQPTPSRAALAKHTRTLRVGDRLDPAELARWLAERRFHATTAVELPGEFSLRGGILDVFSPDWEAPVRVEFFGDEVESLRAFDLGTQRSIAAVASIDITMTEPATNEREHFTAYLHGGAWAMLVEPARMDTEGRQYLERVERLEFFFNTPETLGDLMRLPHVTAASLGEATRGPTCRLDVESVERFGGDFAQVRKELDRLGAEHTIHVVVQTPAEVDRLREVFAPTNAAREHRLHFPLGHLHAGFKLVKQKTLVMSGAELFHRGDIRRLPQRRLGKAIDTFLDLREGDLVVHLSHGIGRYRGLKLLTKDTQVEEHVEIEFAGGARVYVPVAKIDLVQKYVGGTKARPSLAKLGNRSWTRQKQEAERAVVDLAADLLELQALRATRPGIAFAADTEWQREFDAMFPYRETNDQLAAIAAIKGDMHRPRPMDRLLCGDVGYGKTEVSMRAAFKAIDNGYQVAVLVPTTILCEQHFHTFRERMAEFPCEVARLSRFSSPQEQRLTLERLAAGQVDIVVGTHRLASHDVQFHNLGLVIIDEEQRFGVEVKERLKSLRATVDILTMTATPIPRTLHLSLTGLRDISNLETPPDDRLAVETKVARFDRDLIRHAVLRELARGGQIFFIHNRVNDIQIVANTLKQIVPEATLGIGHGQMPEDQLERVMVDFVAHKFDLLVATTIVESGLDIPNANTIFVNEADRYGLADLHQLRGRVGRYKHRAWCYLLVDAHKHITPVAAKRLHAIEEFSDMGAGFAISLRDLELRGAGNLLGTQQSGHIAAVGYEMYCQLLENAVRGLKKMPPQLKLEVDLDLPGEAYLPRDYVPDMRLKIDIYRRLTRVECDQHLSDLRQELSDRFGPPPETVERMLALAELKIDAAVWQIASVHREDRYLVFRYTSRPRAEQLARLTGGKLRVVDDSSAYATIPPEANSPDLLMRFAKSVLRPK